MRTATIVITPLLPWLVLLASCSTPPKPPSVDESRRRPANTAMAVELQVCKTALQTSDLRATHAERLADTAAVTQANVAAIQLALAQLSSQAERNASISPAGNPPGSALPNNVFTVGFGYGSTRVEPPEQLIASLAHAAKRAPLVMLRGRTDGQHETPVESGIARARAAAVRDVLVAAGVSPALIRTTYQPVGDHAADNTSSRGRGLNRRVEIEVYRERPQTLELSDQPSTDTP